MCFEKTQGAPWGGGGALLVTADIGIIMNVVCFEKTQGVWGALLVTANIKIIINIIIKIIVKSELTLQKLFQKYF